MDYPKLLRSFVVAGAAAAITLGAASAWAGVKSSSEKDFYVVLDGDKDKATIATLGPLKVFAQCRVDKDGFDEIKIFATSSTGGWFDSDSGKSHSSGKRIVLFSEDENTGDKDFTEDDGGVAVASRSGHYIAIAGETLGLGLNIFGHDCVAIGTATLITGNP